MKTDRSSLISLNLLIVGGVLFLDQFSKVFLLRIQDLIWSMDLRILTIQFSSSLNSNFAFSIPAPKFLIFIVIFGALFFLIKYWSKTMLANDKISLWLAVIVGGALGNFFDRIRYGGVVDWIEASFFSFTWSSFNIADIAIVVGIIAVMYKLRNKSDLISPNKI